MFYRSFRALFLIALFIFHVLAQKPYVLPPTPARTFDVQHYIIRSKLDFAKKEVAGQTTVRLKPLGKNFKSFELDAAMMDFSAVRLDGSNTPLKFGYGGSRLYITLDREYSPADLISVTIDYTITKPKKGVHFFDESRDRAKRLNNPRQAWTSGQPDENRFWFPSYDYPDDKATSEQFVTVPEKDKVIANGELLETVDNRDGTKTWHYKMPLPHSSYLISFIAGDYVKLEDKYENIPLGYYIYRGEEKIVPLAFNRTAIMIEIYEKMTGVKFPYNKYDQTIITQFEAGGMENITATTLLDAEIFGAGVPSLRPNVHELVAHELAHSWFGNLVTCKSWPHLWLNEGFATFMVAVYREQSGNQTAYKNRIRSDARNYFVSQLNGETPHPLVYGFDKPGDDMFDATTYKKGSVVLYMLRDTVGDEAFWKAVNRYLDRYKFSSVETRDLQAAMEEASGKDLDKFFEQWVYSEGYPDLNITGVYNAKFKKITLTIEQKQKAHPDSVDAFVLPLEIEVVTKKGTVAKTLMLDQKKQIFNIVIKDAPEKIFLDKNEKIMLKKVQVTGDLPIETGKLPLE